MIWVPKLYDLIVKDGLLVDPAQGIHEEMDIAVSRSRVVAVEHTIPKEQASRVIDASQMIVTPGLIDIHVHAAHNLVRLSIDPEQACLLKGSTTVADAGSTGELLYTPFEKFVIKPSRTRIFAFINIESLGMIEFRSPREPADQKWPELLTALDEALFPLFINIEKTVDLVKANRHRIIGIKWAHRGPNSIPFAREAADKADCILMMENHHMPEALKYVKKGDILTHIYHHYFDPLAKPPRYDGLTEDGKIHSEYFDAVRRGVLLDVGHGMGSFVWDVAELAIRETLKPFTISTDLWSASINGPAFDLPTTTAKFMHLGMTLEEVVDATTRNPAVAIGRLGEIGTLRPGSYADIAVFKLQEGKFPLMDCNNEGRIGNQMLVPTHVIRCGETII